MSIAPSPPEPWRIAHRGYHARCVENTLEAFASAYGFGCDLVEFDVQLAADGVPVIFHDDDLRRLGRRSEAVCALPARELGRVELRDPATHAVGRIPTLAEFLAAFGSNPFYLELKVPARQVRTPEYWRDLTGRAVAALRALPLHPLTFVASFHHNAARYALADLDFARTAVIHARRADWLAVCKAGPADPLSRRLFDSIPFALLRRARPGAGGGPPLLVWDVAGDAAWRAVAAAGVAGVVSDEVAEMLRRLAPAPQNKA